MYNLTIDHKYQPLKKLSISMKNRPTGWEAKVIGLQNYYLKNRGETGPRDINTTINYLVNLAFTNKLLEITDDILAQAMAWSAVGMFEIHQIFYDKNITEAFCNEIGSQIVVTHREYGRCLTDIIFTKELWQSIKIRSEYDTGGAITPLSPALKVSFQTSFGNIRISLQIPPLTPSSPSFNMRRLPSKPLVLEELIKQNQISRDHANILTEALSKREIIIIAGEPGSGKTTLANALLDLSDPTWRLIIMEDAREVIISSSKFPMSTRFFMPSVGEDDRYSKRSDEIARLLHRSPDYVFLGELQNSQDTKVAFEGFSAGIRGMATTHARSFDGLVSRWINSHGLDKGLFSSIDYIVFTRRELSDGIVKLSTSNIYYNNPENKNFEEM